MYANECQTKRTNHIPFRIPPQISIPHNHIPQNPHITLKAISLFIPSTEDLENRRPQNEMLVETYANVKTRIWKMKQTKNFIHFYGCWK